MQASGNNESEAPTERKKGFSNPADEWVRQCVLSFLAKPDVNSPTVLEIRRGAFAERLPPVPQLNRVLYQLNDKKVLLKKLQCQGPSKKPRWSLSVEPGD